MLNRSEFPSQYSSIISLTEGDSQYIQQAIEIYNQGLGQDYIDLETLMDYLTNPTDHINQAFIWSGALRGILIASVMTDLDKQKYDNNIRQLNPDFTLLGKRVGLIKSITVEEQYRQHGIGTELTIQAINKFEQMGCTDLFSVSWVSNREDNSQKMFEKLGFERIGQIDEYWKQDSIIEGYECPVCGNPCVCTAVFYWRKV